MLLIPGYETSEQIFKGSNSLVYRGIRKQDSLPVILKILRNDYPSTRELARFRREFEITQKIKASGSIRAHELIKYKNSMVLIAEDIGADSLSNILLSRQLTIQEILWLAVKISETLAQIHLENIIHMDINPSNIVWNPKSKIVKVIDFGLSTELSRERQQIVSPNILEGTLAYISPEQTGRMNRFIDYRSDLYSFGATLYHLLTNRLAFPANDATELVHAHIARVPDKLNQLDTNIPETLSNIVLKLMEKTAEERYQSADALHLDLNKCLRDFELSGGIKAFDIAQNDVSHRFHIPQKLYGRRTEVKTLLESFNRVSKGQTELMLVAGYSGIGKSSLLTEIHKPALEKRGWFTYGKFDQYQKNIPYSAFLSAFSELSEQLLSETVDELNTRKERLNDALGGNAKVIIDVIPELELILGKHPPIPDLGPAETLNRFNITFQNFVRALASEEHPLIISLDDLQWADMASLSLLKVLLVDPESHHILFLGAYRDNEVNASHPLMLTFEEIKEEQGKIHRLELAPLDQTSIERLLIDTLKNNTDKIKQLGQLVLDKTGGNPFFVTQFLTALYKDGMLEFQTNTNSWDWNLNSLKKRAITDNVVDLMIQKIKKLPGSTIKLLQICACIGNAVPLSVVSLISEYSLPQLTKKLWPAFEEEILLPMGQYHNLLFRMRDDDETEGLGESVKFQHDKILQAAYETIDKDTLTLMHLKIGRLLFKNIKEDELDESIFEIISHFNFARSKIKEANEKILVAELNQMASKKAMDSSAFKSALEYTRIGLNFLTPSSWQTHYQLSFLLHRQGAECEYLNANLEQSDILFKTVLENAKTNKERAEILSIHLLKQIGLVDSVKSLKLLSQGLGYCGVRFPEYKDISGKIPEEFRIVDNLLKDKSIPDLLDTPPMSDELKGIALELLLLMSGSFYITGDMDGFTYCTLLSVRITLIHGQVDLSSATFCFYAILLVSQGNYKKGYEFGKLGYDLSERYPDYRQKSWLDNLFGAFILHWGDSFKNGVRILKNGYKVGLESGNLLYAAFNAVNIDILNLMQGVPLPEIVKQLDPNLKRAYRNKFNACTDCGQTIRSFIGFMFDSSSGSDIKDENYEPEQLKRIKETYGFTYFTHYRMEKYFFLENWDGALQAAGPAGDALVLMPSFPIEVEHYFYLALIISQKLTETFKLQSKETKELLKQFITCKRKLRLWAELSPDNNLHRYQLLQAESLRLQDKPLRALEFYQEAIRLAGDGGFIHHSAISHELCAKFWFKLKNLEYAEKHISDAFYLYGKWGAGTKLKLLSEKYPSLDLSLNRRSRSEQKTGDTHFSDTSSSGSISESLDLISVTKASQAISGETNLEKLLLRLMDVIIENAGAQKGILILHQEEKWLLEAELDSVKNKTTVLQDVPLEKSRTVPESLIRFVMRSGKTVIIEDATLQHKFSQDTYIKNTQPYSVLCMALKHNHRVEGVLYLENNSAAGAFKDEHIDILKILLPQAVISIKNAYLFKRQKEAEEKVRDINAELEERVKLRTYELEMANQELEAFSHSVSHDLRAPLRRTIGFVEIIKEDYEEFMNEGLMKLITRIEKSSVNMNELIDDLLTLSKVNQYELVSKTFDAHSLCEQIILEFQTSEPKRKSEIFIDDSLEITGDLKLIKILFQNLLGNSWKYSSQKDKTFIQIGRLKPDDAAKLKSSSTEEIYFVRDQGAGFDMKYVDRIFKSFQRLHSPREFEGTGIGLATVQRIITRHGGRIWAEGKVDEGAVFYFTLEEPKKPVDEKL